MRQRLTAIRVLQHEHCVNTLCKVLNVNRSTYYKQENAAPSNRSTENSILRSKILTIYNQSSKRLGAYKIKQRLLVEYGLKIGVGRIYRLMSTMLMPKMSTIKPKHKKGNGESGRCNNLLKQSFSASKPNTIWVSGECEKISVN